MPICRCIYIPPGETAPISLFTCYLAVNIIFLFRSYSFSSTATSYAVIRMIYLPPLRRFLVPALASVTLIILYRALPLSQSLPSFVFHQPPAPPQGIHVPISAIQKPLPLYNASNNHLSPPSDYFYNYEETKTRNQSSLILWQPILDPNLAPLFQCTKRVNKYTGHVRLPNIIRNISNIPPGSPSTSDSRIFWKPHRHRSPALVSKPIPCRQQDCYGRPTSGKCSL